MATDTAARVTTDKMPQGHLTGIAATCIDLTGVTAPGRLVTAAHLKGGSQPSQVAATEGR